MIKPPKLLPGDTIGLLATARKVVPEELFSSVKFLENAGYKVVIPPGLYQSDFQFAGSDFSRAHDLQFLIDHPEVKAIWCARGGYGTVRIMDLIDLTNLKKCPKWLIGFSDVTVLLARFYKEGMMSVHGPMAINFAAENPSSGLYLLPEIKQKFGVFLHEPITSLSIPAHPMNTFHGVYRGRLFGGNLSVMMSLSGSAQDVTNADLYIIEDLDEYLYHFDRMIQWLFRSGKLKSGVPLLVGHLNDMKDLNPENPFGKSAAQIVSETALKYGIPVVFGLPFGHQSNNELFVIGARYQIESQNGTVSIQEIPDEV